MAHGEEKPLPSGVVTGTWLALWLFGFALNLWILPKDFEATAFGLLCRQRPVPPVSTPIRVVDVSGLYGSMAPGSVPLPAMRLQSILDSLDKNLKGKDRPSAIALDFDYRHRRILGSDGHLPEHALLIDSAYLFSKRTNIPVYLGSSDLDYVPEEALSIRSASLDERPAASAAMFASTLAIAGNPYLMPAEILRRVHDPKNTEKGREVHYQTIGYRLAQALVGAKADEGLDPATGNVPEYLVRAELHEPEAASEANDLSWRLSLVDHSLVRIRKEITVAVKGTVDGKPSTVNDVLDGNALKILRATTGHPAILIGVASIGEQDDLSVYDPSPGWLSPGEPIKSIYAHANLAYTRAFSTLTPLGHAADFALDLLLGLGALSLAMAKNYGFVATKSHSWLPAVLKRTGLMPAYLLFGIPLISGAYAAFRSPGRWNPHSRALAFSLGKLWLFLLALGLSFLLARAGYFWIGFLGTAVYLLLEELLSNILESGYAAKQKPIANPAPNKTEQTVPIERIEPEESCSPCPGFALGFLAVVLGCAIGRDPGE